MSRRSYRRPTIVRQVVVRPYKRYKFLTFCLDMILACLTGGLWLFWVAFKFLRTGHR